jgi:hypothetical protein
MPIGKKLKIFNGRAFLLRNPKDPKWNGVSHNASAHAFVAAYSRADARRLIAEYWRDPGDTELRVYWHEGAWGNDMAGITPERAIWIRFAHNQKPVKVWPPEDVSGAVPAVVK